MIRRATHFRLDCNESSDSIERLLLFTGDSNTLTLIAINDLLVRDVTKGERLAEWEVELHSTTPSCFIARKKSETIHASVMVPLSTR